MPQWPEFKKEKAAVFISAAGLAVYCWLAMLMVPDQWGITRYGIVVILLTLSIFFRRKGYLRYIYVYLAMFAALQYWHWRLTQTISYTGVPDIAACLTLVAAEFYSAMLFFMSLFVGISPLRRKLISPADDIRHLPTVDVFIPTYNEPVEISKITVLAACNMTYPNGRFQVHLLDDGSTEEKRNSSDHSVRKAAQRRYRELKEFCRKAGITYHTRKDNSHAKAGNLNNAFQKTRGDVIAVLDCDHVPTQDFLIKTTHYFLKDPKLFLVQTPHFFLNPDPLDRNLKMFYAAPSENEMFYRGILPEMDFWESAYFCGSAAVLSRRCLDTTDGFRGETVTEDAETSIALHSKGFRSIYIPMPLVCGLTPDIFSDFISQKVRWAQGMIQIFLLKKIFRNPGLKWYQKICYFNCVFYWFFSFARLIFLVAPLFFLFFKLNVYNASMHQIIIYTVPYLMTLFITHNYLHGDVRWPLFSEIYEILQSIYILPAITGVLVNPRKPSFRVTAKGDTLSEDRLSALAYPFHIIFWALFISLGICIYKYIHEPIYRATLLITGCWILFNITMMFFTLGVVYERKQVRRFHRAKAWRPVTVRANNEKFQARLTDLSWNGAGIEIKIPKNKHLQLRDRLTIFYTHRDNEVLEIPVEVRFKKVIRKEPVRIKGHGEKPRYLIIKIGASIVLDNSIESTKKKALFVYGDSERWHHFWKMKTKRQNIISVLYYLTKNASPWSIKAGMEFFHYNMRLLKEILTRMLHTRKKINQARTASIKEETL